jgi:hypothetical protein
MLIKKTVDYKVGICSITYYVGKIKKLDFDNDKPIEVTEEQIKLINKSWFEIVEPKKEVKDGN